MLPLVRPATIAPPSFIPPAAEDLDDDYDEVSIERGVVEERPDEDGDEDPPPD